MLFRSGHNDQKQTGEGKGAYGHYTESLRTFVTEARKKGAFPIFCTPTERRNFDAEGKVVPTLGEFPEAMKKLAQEMRVPVLDLNSQTQIFYNVFGAEKSTKAFVHYPENTFPGQEKALEDNTHFNPYGAYQIAKMVVQALYENRVSIYKYLRSDVSLYDVTKPDCPDSFKWYPSPFTEIQKPDGN